MTEMKKREVSREEVTGQAMEKMLDMRDEIMSEKEELQRWKMR